MCAWGLLTGSHKQVAASLPRGPAAAAMMGGGTAAVWRAERREALQQHPSAGGAVGLGGGAAGINKSQQEAGCSRRRCRDSCHPLRLN